MNTDIRARITERAIDKAESYGWPARSYGAYKAHAMVQILEEAHAASDATTLAELTALAEADDGRGAGTAYTLARGFRAVGIKGVRIPWSETSPSGGFARGTTVS